MRPRFSPPTCPLLLLLLLSLHGCVCDAEGFTFPNAEDYVFIVGDIVNITWTITTPRLNLCEICNVTLCFLNNATNTFSYLWPASRTIYRESGCVFELQPLGVNGVSVPPNITSDLFGVNNRFSDDPQPTLYNGWNATSTAASSTASATATSTATATAAPVHTQAASATPTATPHPYHGLSMAARVGLGVGMPLAALLALTWAYFLLPAHKRPVLIWRAQRSPDGSSSHPPPTEKAGKVGHTREVSDISTMSGGTTVGDNISPITPEILEAGRGREGRVSELMGSPRSELEARESR